MIKHDQIRHLRNLRLLLSQDKSPLALFMAAGCPLSVKDADGRSLLPDMAGLSKKIEADHVHDASTSPYLRLKVELGKAGISPSNLEDMLSFIRSMKSVSSGDALVRGFKEHELKDLEDSICKKIAESVSKDLPKDENSYRQMARWISSIDRTVPVELFTTNYDLLAEQALEEQNVPFFDGFSGSRYPFFDIHSVESNASLPSFWVRLWMCLNQDMTSW